MHTYYPHTTRRSRFGMFTAPMLICLLITGTSFGQTNSGKTQWKGGSGIWTAPKMWSDGPPTPLVWAAIEGKSDVSIPTGRYEVGLLQVGARNGDHATVQINGGELVNRREAIRIASMTGIEGEIILNDGALHSFSPLLVACSKQPDLQSKGTVTIRGGSFLVRLVTLGWTTRSGAQARFAVEGSRPSSISILDGLILRSSVTSSGQPGSSTLSFTLDEQGVTPIVIQSPKTGLIIESSGTDSKCLLEIALSAVPPLDDIVLVSSHVRTRGTFTGLPEGSEVSADYHGQTYRWTLTYKGGPSGRDLVLTKVRGHQSGAPITHCRPLPEPSAPLWQETSPYGEVSAPKEIAFPGAEGFGATSRGGSGGKILYIDNLEDSGDGSLRAAIETPGPRTILFRKGGVIRLKTPLVIREPFVTIDGQNAPGEGIMIRDHGIAVVDTHDVILRHLRIRLGDEAKRDRLGEHAVYFEGAKRCIADHLSLSWTTSKVLSVTKMSDEITIQWCILSESLNFVRHGFASLAGGARVTWHHNLLAHNLSRNVRFQGLVEADFRNNVIYDWGHTAGYGEFSSLNYVGNYLKAGPSTTQNPPYFHNGDAAVAKGALYVAGNIMENRPDISQDNWLGVGYDREIAAPKPFPVPSVETDTAERAFERVMTDVGATLPKRDTVDERIVREVKEGTGRIIDSVSDVGGWIELPEASAQTLDPISR